MSVFLFHPIYRDDLHLHLTLTSFYIHILLYILEIDRLLSFVSADDSGSGGGSGGSGSGSGSRTVCIIGSGFFKINGNDQWREEL